MNNYQHSLILFAISLLFLIIMSTCSYDPGINLDDYFSAISQDYPWQYKADIPEGLAGSSVFIDQSNNAIYVIGGTYQYEDDTGLKMGYSNSVYRYSIDNNSWKRLNISTVRRAYAISFQYNNYFYIYGGVNKTGVLDVWEKFDYLNEEWHRYNPNPDGDAETDDDRWEYYLYNEQTRIYTWKPTDDLFRFDSESQDWEWYNEDIQTGVEENKWQGVSDLGKSPVKSNDFPDRGYSSSVVYENNLYMMGGQGPENLKGDIYSFDLTNFDIPPKPEKLSVALDKPRKYHSCILNGNKCYIVGGQNQVESLSSYEIFDTETNAMDECEICYSNFVRSNAAVTFANNHIYAIAGLDFNDEESLYLNNVEQFDISSNTWIQIKQNIILPLAGASAIYNPDNGLIYVLGGKINGNTYSTNTFTLNINNISFTNTSSIH